HLQRAERGEAAAGPAHAGDALRIDNFLINSPLHRIIEILLHAATVFVIPGVEELQSEAGRATIIFLEDSVTAVGQELNFRLVVIMITIPRAAVNQEHKW